MVVVTALLSISNAWGMLMVLSLIAGAGAIAVVPLPIVSPATTLPTTKGVALLGLGAMATIATGVCGLNWIGYIFEYFTHFDVVQFLVGLAAAAVLRLIGFQAFQAERVIAAPPAA